MNTRAKQIIAGLVVAGTIAGGTAFILRDDSQVPADDNTSQEYFITWEEYQIIMLAYDEQVQLIKNQCDIDIRCKRKNGKPEVLFGNPRSIKDVVTKLNDWVLDGDNLKYKK